MGTKTHPGQFDCYSRAEPDEPIFTLRGKDPSAPLLIELWAELRAASGEDPAVIQEAHDCAGACYEWMRKLGRLDRWKSVADAWFQLTEKGPTGERLDFDLSIGQLDRVMSKLIAWSKDRARDEHDQQTLKHHAEDMIAAGEKMLRELFPASTYTCEHCGIASPKQLWGPGHVTCPKCRKVAQPAAENRP